MKKQFAIILFLAISLAVKVDASVSKSDDIATPDITGTYIMYYSSSLVSDIQCWDIYTRYEYFYSDSTYVNVVVEMDSIVSGQYIIKYFGNKKAFDVTATYNTETGNLEIPRQPYLPRLDELHPPCDLVNANDHNAPIILSLQSDGLVIHDEWAAIYTEDDLNGEYYYKGKNTVFLIPNAIIEWDNTIVGHMSEYVRLEQEGNSSELAIENFCNRGKRIIVNLENDSLFWIPAQHVSHFKKWYWSPPSMWEPEGSWQIFGEFNGFLCQWESWKQPVTGKWTSTTMVSDCEFVYGIAIELSYGRESPFVITMLSGSIISPFASNELGDVNGDGKVNVSDVSVLISMILGTTTMDESTADVNGDGRVNVSDVSALINIILGIK